MSRVCIYEALKTKKSKVVEEKKDLIMKYAAWGQL